MRLNHGIRFKRGFRPIIEAQDGYLLGGRMVDEGPVFERFCEALYFFNDCIETNLALGRSVKGGRIVPFEGKVNVLIPTGKV